MRKVKLFISTSLDGYIARSNGEIDWLYTDQDYGYKSFLETVDTLLMGGVTYRQILGFSSEWPYSDKRAVVFTHDLSLESNDEITFIHHDLAGATDRLKREESKKDIWLVGGASINTELLNAGLIDEIWLFKMPLLLGSGIPLFHPIHKETWLKIHEVEEFESGVLKMIYVKRDK